jgi:hypothetical protein
MKIDDFVLTPAGKLAIVTEVYPTENSVKVTLIGYYSHVIPMHIPMYEVVQVYPVKQLKTITGEQAWDIAPLDVNCTKLRK